MNELIELDKAEDEVPVMVIFNMWGQECFTKVPSQDEALHWIGECYSRDFLEPKEIIGRDGVVLMDEDALHEFVMEL